MNYEITLFTNSPVVHGATLSSQFSLLGVGNRVTLPTVVDIVGIIVIHSKSVCDFTHATVLLAAK
jgi:hypothetical protein